MGCDTARPTTSREYACSGRRKCNPPCHGFSVVVPRLQFLQFLSSAVSFICSGRCFVKSSVFVKLRILLLESYWRIEVIFRPEQTNNRHFIWISLLFSHFLQIYSAFASVITTRIFLLFWKLK